MSKHSLCIRGHTIGTSYNQQGIGYPTNLITFSNVGVKEQLHPTQKPVALLEYLINTYTSENETVLDNCMGSGSTGVACINTKRNFIGMELDTTYFKIASDRINEHKLQLDSNLEKFEI